MDTVAGSFAGLYLIAVLFLFVLAVLWFFLPFAVFGTKAKLDAITAELRKLNANIEALRRGDAQ